MNASIPILGFLLVLGRIAGVFVTMPVVGSRNYPVRIKLGLIFFVTIMVAPYANLGIPIDVTNSLDFFLKFVNEILFGLCLGLIVTFFINFIYVAGDVIDYLIGFSMVSVVNPMDESQIPITANILYMYISLLFLSLNMHHKVILSLAQSFNLVPLGSFFNHILSFQSITTVFTQSVLIGISIASPIIITILVADLILGLLAKAMPGMNVFILGMPLKILIGLSFFLVLTPVLLNLLGGKVSEAFDHMQDYIMRLSRL